MKSRAFLWLAVLCLLVFPVLGHATACPTDSLANVITMGNCTIAGTTFTFSPTSFISEYYPGPFAGDTMTAPSASAITFTPDTTVNNPGFTLSADFSVTGGYTCAYGSGLCGPYGNKFDANFGYIGVAAPAGVNIIGISAALGAVSVTRDVSQNRAQVDIRWGRCLCAVARGRNADTVKFAIAACGREFLNQSNLHSGLELLRQLE